jgi:hypothetical protein
MKTLIIVYTLTLLCQLDAFQPPPQHNPRVKLDLKEYFTIKLLHYMQDNKYPEFVALLDQATIIDPHENFCGNKNLLHHAAEAKRSIFIEHLLSLGLDVRSKDIHGHSVMWHLTAGSGPYDDPTDIIPSVALLVGAGAFYECAQKEFCPYNCPDRDKIRAEVFSMLLKSKIA